MWEALKGLPERDWNDILTAAEDYRVNRLKGKKHAKPVVKSEVEEPTEVLVEKKPVKKVLVNRRRPDDVQEGGSGAK